MVRGIRYFLGAELSSCTSLHYFSRIYVISIIKIRTQHFPALLLSLKTELKGKQGNTTNF
jgi:hypothetical protein